MLYALGSLLGSNNYAGIIRQGLYMIYVCIHKVSCKSFLDIVEAMKLFNVAGKQMMP